MQTNEWGQLKAGFDWSVENIQCGPMGAKILYRKLPFGKTIGYIPKGPIGSFCQDLWTEIDEESRRKQAIFLKFEPDLWEPATIQLPNQNIFTTIPSNPIQPRRW